MQAAFLYVVLFYTPAILQRDAALMRMLVDKHYVDSWILLWAPGFLADLALDWDNYKVLTHSWVSLTSAQLIASFPTWYSSADHPSAVQLCLDIAAVLK